MISIMYLSTIIIPLHTTNRIISLLLVLLYTLIGGGSYLYLTYKFGLIQNIFGDKLIEKIRKIKKKVIR